MEQASEILQDLGYGPRDRSSQTRRSQPLMRSSVSNVRGLLNRPPLVKYQRKPDEIVNGDDALLKQILIGYRKSGMNWKDYSAKLEPSTRETLTRIFVECRRNGFIGPEVRGEMIVWHQLTGNPKYVDQCTLCHRKYAEGECRSTHDKRGDFVPCWKGDVK